VLELFPALFPACWSEKDDMPQMQHRMATVLAVRDIGEDQGTFVVKVQRKSAERKRSFFANQSLSAFI